jgi:hypothetical protein
MLQGTFPRVHLAPSTTCEDVLTYGSPVAVRVSLTRGVPTQCVPALAGSRLSFTVVCATTRAQAGPERGCRGAVDNADGGGRSFPSDGEAEPVAGRPGMPAVVGLPYQPVDALHRGVRRMATAAGWRSITLSVCASYQSGCETGGRAAWRSAGWRAPGTRTGKGLDREPVRSRPTGMTSWCGSLARQAVTPPQGRSLAPESGSGGVIGSRRGA